jgi:hypothetical protein
MKSDVLYFRILSFLMLFLQRCRSCFDKIPRDLYLPHFLWLIVVGSSTSD